MPCSITLSGLARDCSPNMGGIVEVYIANFADVNTVTVTDNVITAISMANSAKFKAYSFRKNTGSLTSTLTKDTAAGITFVTSDLVLQFSRMDTTKRVEISALSIGDLAVICRDCNGVCWYLGKDAPVNASAGDGQTGTAKADANRYSITLQDESADWPLEVDSSIVAGLVA